MLVWAPLQAYRSSNLGIRNEFVMDLHGMQVIVCVG
jgi:hypothetical protein